MTLGAPDEVRRRFWGNESRVCSRSIALGPEPAIMKRRLSWRRTGEDVIRRLGAVSSREGRKNGSTYEGEAGRR